MRTLISAMCFTSLAITACSAAPEDESDVTSDELRTITSSERVGDLAFGESKTVAYSDRPLYRALRITAAKGDLLDVSVQGAGLDPKAWIVRASDSRTLASNDDESASSRDARVEYVARAAGDYLVVFRENNREEGSFTVSLAPRAGGTTPPPASNGSLYGFVSGRRVVAKGVGDTDHPMTPSYSQCRRKVNRNIPCGGWATVTQEAGKTNVTFGIMAHSDYWTYVSGHQYFEGMNQVPPPYNNRFWDSSGSVTLDAAGNASLQRISRHQDGTISRTNKYELAAVDGAITIALDSRGDQRTCNRVDETCTIRVLAQ